MKCQNCGQNEANFIMHSNFNGDVTEACLCSDCAEKLGYLNSPDFSMPGMFDDLLSGLTGRAFRPLFAQPRRVGAPSPAAAACAAPAKPVAEIDEDAKRLRELNLLREQMKSSAEAEDFERAMELRDEIKKLEG